MRRPLAIGIASERRARDVDHRDRRLADRRARRSTLAAAARRCARRRPANRAPRRATSPSAAPCASATRSLDDARVELVEGLRALVPRRRNSHVGECRGAPGARGCAGARPAPRGAARACAAVISSRVTGTESDDANDAAGSLIGGALAPERRERRGVADVCRPGSAGAKTDGPARAESPATEGRVDADRRGVEDRLPSRCSPRVAFSALDVAEHRALRPGRRGSACA